MTTTDLRIGELFAGYGGLGMGVQAVLGGQVVWYSDVCKFDKDGNAGHYEPHRGPCRILEHRLPGVPNHGDITKIKWTPDCPDCGTFTGARLFVHWDDDLEPWYFCEACESTFDVAVRLDDAEADRIPEPVHILTGGSPCQDLSHAGRRAGMTDGTRSNLWVAMREAIAYLRPLLVVWENVRGAYSAAADSAVEPCPGCVGDGTGVSLRALGRVLGDLSDLRYDARWHGLQVSDPVVGGPHGRFRVFVAASPASDEGRIGDRDGAAAADAADLGRERPGSARDWRAGSADGHLLPTPRASDGTKGGPGQRGSSGDLMLPSAVATLPTPTARDWKNVGDPEKTPERMADRGQPLNEVIVNALLPTPAVNDMGEGKTVERWDEWTADMQAKHGNGNGHGKSLAIEAQRLLPTPSVADSAGGHERRGGARGDELLLNGIAKAQADGRLLPTPRTTNNENRQSDSHGGEDGNFYGLLHDASRWGDYAPAIARWEQRLYAQDRIAEKLQIPDYTPVGRPAPEPTQTSSKGNPQLAAAFVEWMMGLPEGWVTDVPGITRNEALKALGNGVVPQQAAAALREMFAWEVAA